MEWKDEKRDGGRGENMGGGGRRPETGGRFCCHFNNYPYRAQLSISVHNSFCLLPAFSPSVSLSRFLYLSTALLDSSCLHSCTLGPNLLHLDEKQAFIAAFSHLRGGRNPTKQSPWRPSRRRCRCWNWTRRTPSTGQSRLRRTRKQQRTNASRWGTDREDDDRDGVRVLRAQNLK